MNLYHCHILLFLFVFKTGFPQQEKGIEVSYETISSLDLDSLDEEIKSNPQKLKFIKTLKENSESMEYVLQIKSGKSTFETIKKMQIGSKVNLIARIENKQRFYVDNEVYLEQTEFSGTELLIEEKFNQQKWSLSKETKIILNKKCYKATLTEDGIHPMLIEAWYDPSLPYQHGPKGYHGLPGLILEMTQNEKLTFRAKKVEYREDIFIIKPTTGKKVSRSEHKKNVDKMAASMLELYSN